MRPGPRSSQLLALWLGLSIGAVAWDPLIPVWAAAGLGLLGLAGIDAWALWRQTPPRAARSIPHSLPLGVWREVRVRVTNESESRIVVDVFDHYPEPAEVRQLPQTARIGARGWAEIRYRFRPRERGERAFGPVQLRVYSPLHIWRRNRLCGDRDTVRIYPNFAAVAKYALLATDHRLSQIGVRKRRRRGEGLEFHQLREYRPGDSLRQVDWKATSRHLKLISREYQAERDQQVVFLIDCGRRMMARDEQLSHFDHSLNSMLLLAYVALRQGDAVGLMAFGGAQRYLPPHKGVGMVTTLLNQLYDLQPTTRSPDYVRAATEIVQRLRKRSLIVIVTNLRDEDGAEILGALDLLRRHHLVLLASLRERVIGTVLARPVLKFDDALRLAATHYYLLARRKVHDAIVESGALSLDVEPGELPIQLVNRYLDIKLSGQL